MGLLHPRTRFVSGSALRDATGHGRSTQNHNVGHFSFPGRWKPYLARRLSRQVLTPDVVAAATAVMPHRPSTSAGPGSFRSASSRSINEKRKSRDDMLLTVDGWMGTERLNPLGMQPYLMGRRGGNLPTPEASPDQAAASSMTSLLAPATINGHESFMTSMEVPIGMALGSPSQVSEIQPKLWQPQSVTPPRRTPSPPPPPPAAAPQMVLQTAPPAAPLERRKTTRQRIFRALFGRGKQSNTAKAADLISANSSAVSLSSTSTGREATGSAVPPSNHAISGKRGQKHVPLLVRSHTDLPTTAAPVEPRQWRQPPPPPVPPASSWNDPSRRVVPNSEASGPLRLDVEIPSITLERYSVMFSGVLNPQQQKRNSKMTLLERRQATLEKLKSVNDRVVAQREEEVKQFRRASSPQPTRSPSFPTLPPMPGRQQLAIPPSPRLRAHSSPAAIPSPTVDGFSDYLQPLNAPPPRREKKGVPIISPRTMKEQERADHQQKLLEEQQQHQSESEQTFPPRKDSHFAPDKSVLILDTSESPTEQFLNVSSSRQSDEPKMVSPFLLKPTVYQPPETRIMDSVLPTRSPPSPPQSSMPETTSPPILSPESPTFLTASSPALPVHKGHTLSPSVDLAAAAEEEAEEADPIIKAAVEISVARTISISRRTGARPKRVESCASSTLPSSPPGQHQQQPRRSPSQPPTQSRSGKPPPIPLARSAGSLQRSRSVKANQITITRAGTLKARGPGAAPKLTTTTEDLGRVAETKQELLINSPCLAPSTPGAVTPGNAGSELPREVLASVSKSERVEIVTRDVADLVDSDSGREDSGEAEGRGRGRRQQPMKLDAAEARYVVV